MNLARLVSNQSRAVLILIALICAGGYRSSIAASLFERGGRRAVINVVGGMAAWNAAGLPTVA